MSEVINVDLEKKYSKRRIIDAKYKKKIMNRSEF